MKRLAICGLFWATCCLAADLTTLDGKTYQNVQVKRVEPDGIYVFHSGGGTKILFTQLPEEIRKQYNYTPPPTQGPGNAITQPATAIPPPASQIPPPSTNAQPSPPANTDPNQAAQDTLKLRKIAAQQMIAEGEQILVAAGMAHNYRGISRGTRVKSFANSVQRRGQSLIDKGKAMLAQAEDELAVLNGEPLPVRADTNTRSKGTRRVAYSSQSATKTKTVLEPNSTTSSTSATAQNTASFQPFSAPLLDTIKQLMAPEHRSYSFHKIDNKWFGLGGTAPVYLIGQNNTLEAMEIPASLEYLLQNGFEADLSAPERLMLPLFRNSWKRARALIEFATDRQTSEKVENACKSMVGSWNSAGRPFKKDVADDRYSIDIEKGASDISHPVNIRIKARRPQPTATTNTPAFNGKAVQVEISSKAKTWLTSLGTEMDSLMFGAMRNDPISQTLIGATLLSSKDVELCKEAIRLLQAATDQGNATAQYELARIYREGINRNSEQLIAANIRLAKTMYEKAAKQGHWDSLELLDDPEFWKKHGFNDRIESYKWCLLAEQQEEVPYGESRLRALEQQMTSVQIGEAKRLAEEFKSRHWLRKAADQGAKQILAKNETTSTKATPNNEFNKLKAKAEAGDAEAQDTLAALYSKGIDVARDPVEAVKWMRKAAEQGIATSQYNLAICYASGSGVEKDHAEAAKWYRKAAEQGHAWAQNNLGMSYAKGEGVVQDYEEAVRWFRRAAEQGDAAAQVALGGAYHEGIGVPQNEAKAVEWWKKAAAQGNVKAQQLLRNVR